MEGLLITGRQDDLVIPVAFDWPAPDRILEAIGDSTAKRTQRANRAGKDVIADRFRLEKATQERIAKQLAQLKDALLRRLLSGDGGVTDFKRYTVTQLAADVDRLVIETSQGLTTAAEKDYKAADQLGNDAAEQPLGAAQLQVGKRLPGLDSTLVQAAFGNTVDLLTPPMQKYATQVKQALRGVALAGDNKFGAIAKLRDQIGGPNLQTAQYQAERIIRTELGRTFNQATYNRLVDLSKDFPFLRKGWRATADARTRIGHREAGKTYARGQGIRVADPFKVNVYDERKGKTPTLIGVATLQFPVDPNAKPEGRVAAGATIMCRCNSFVDMNQAEFAAYTRSKVATALGNVQAPKPEPAPKPVPLPKPKPPAVTKPKVRVPKVKVPTPATVTPKAVAATGPQGTPISSKVQIGGGAIGKLGRQVFGIIDKIMGDGPLDTIPLKASGGRFYGVFRSYRGGFGQPGRAASINVSANGMKAHPMNTLAHETGHWIDSFGVFKPQQPAGTWASETAHDAAMVSWREAVKGTDAIRTLQSWAKAGGSPTAAEFLKRNNPGSSIGYEGDGTVPKGVNRKHLNYLLSGKEVWARAYAQYVAVASNDPAMMAELRRMQAQATTGAVPAGRPFNYHPMGTEAGAAAGTTNWDYPVVWSDADFAPVKTAFDNLFRSLGWIK